jgi:hypothetical protein
MPFKQFGDGEVLTAADVKKYLIQQHHVIKPADQSLASSTVPVNDLHLILPLLVNTTYWLEIFLRYDTIQAADLSITWAVPAGTNLYWTHGGLGLSAPDALHTISRSALETTSIGLPGGAAVGAGTTTIVIGEGLVVSGGTPGNLQFKWAQNTSNATASKMQVGSSLIIQRLTF